MFRGRKMSSARLFVPKDALNLQRKDVDPIVLEKSREIFHQELTRDGIFRQLAKLHKFDGVFINAEVYSSAGREIIDEAYRLVKEGEGLIVFDPKYTDVVLLVGNTGTGKSTLAQFIATDQSKLFAVEYPVGSGNFIIQDEDGKISKPGETTTSKTLYPEFIVSYKGDVAYYDLPGFQDTRGTASDIASSIMTNMVFAKSNSIKVHICVDYEVAIGKVNRGADFIQAIANVGEFIKDAFKFKASFSMSATKVPLTVKEDEDEEGNPIYIPVPDEDILKALVTFISTEIIPATDKKMEEAIDPKIKQSLVNAGTIFRELVEEKNANYTRIGLFRVPQKEGTLDKSKLMQKSREGILKAITENTNFTTVSEDDFGMAVSKDTKLQMLEIANELNQEIKEAMDSIAKIIEAEIKLRMSTSKDWKDSIDYFILLNGSLKEVVSELQTLPKLTQQFLRTFQLSLRNADVEVSSELFKFLEDEINYIDFIERVLERQNVGVVPRESLDKAFTQSNQGVLWYQMMYQIYDALAVYAIQENTTLYNVSDIKNWGKGGDQGLKISMSNLDEFLKNIKVERRPLGDDFDFSEERFNELNRVIYLTLADKPTKSVESGTLIIKGYFIRIHDVVEYYNANKNVSAIHVFASCAIFLDEDLAAPGIHLALIGPHWEVVRGARKISLDGIPGEDRTGVPPPSQGQVVGDPGKPGGNGNPSGHFLGIVETIVDPGSLKISANGGNGGSGQTGGKGGPGIKGEDGDGRIPSNNRQKIPNGERNVDWWKDTGRSWIEYKFVYFVYHKYYHINAVRQATSGMRGGDGGAGGLGGYKGDIALLIFSQNGRPREENDDGRTGNIGRGGDGGDKAKHGDDIMAYHWHTGWGEETMYDAEWEGRVATYDKGYSNPGEKGKDGGNSSDIGQPKPQVQQSIMALAINDFKGFAISIATSSAILRTPLSQFLKKITSHTGVDVIYDVLAFLNELIVIEKLFYTIYQELNLTPYYQSLLNRIKTYADTQEILPVERLALGTVYSSCLGKICFLDLKIKALAAIVDLQTYMGLTISKVDEMKVMDRRLAIKGFQGEFQNNIDLKITEANQLMANKVSPAIEKCFVEMDSLIEALVEETMEKLKEAEEHVKELQELQKKTNSNLFIRGFLGILKIGGALASCLGPIGAAVGSVITAGTTIGESLIVDPSLPPGESILLPPGAKEGLDELTKLLNGVRESKINDLEASLNLIESEIAESSEDIKANLGDLTEKVQALRSQFETEKGRQIAEDDDDGKAKQVENLQVLEKEVHKTVKDKEQALKDEIAKGDEAKKKTLTKVQKIGNGIKLVQTSLDVYNKFKSDKDKLDAIGQALDEADEQIQALLEYERNIYIIMFPLVRKIRENIREVQASIGGKSQVALDVTKWEIQSSLKGVKRSLELSMEGFDVQTRVAGVFEDLQEALNLQIHIYDRLALYHDQQQLGDYIANIGSPGDFTNLLKGTKYEKDVLTLDITIQSNLILLEFENAMHAFKQWVFPFARQYLEKSYLPPSLTPPIDQQSLTEMVAIANKQLTAAKNDVATYWATIQGVDKFLFEGKFYTNEHIGGPFFLWSGKEHKARLDALFRGEEISFLADIEQAPEFVGQRRAIKFQSVFIRFLLNTTDQETQRKFKDAMNYFILELVHNGNSYYEFLDGIFVIPGDPLTLSYSFKGTESGDPDVTSVSRGKLLNGDLLFSPYTLWTLKLVADKPDGWEKLKEGNFADLISVELAGRGRYIYDTKDELKRLDLRPDDYYTLYRRQGDESNRRKQKMSFVYAMRERKPLM